MKYILLALLLMGCSSQPCGVIRIIEMRPLHVDAKVVITTDKYGYFIRQCTCSKEIASTLSIGDTICSGLKCPK